MPGTHANRGNFFFAKTSVSCRDGISSFLLLIFLGWAVHFFLPFDLYHIIMTTDPMDSKAAKLPVMSSIFSRVVLLQLHLPPILCIIQNHFASLCLVSMMWDTLCPSFDTFTSCQLHRIIQKLTERLPSSTLEIACPNGKFFTLDDKFTSLAFS